MQGKQIVPDSSQILRDAIFKASDYQLRPQLAGLVYKQAARKAAAIGDLELSKRLLQLAVREFGYSGFFDGIRLNRIETEVAKDLGAMFPEDKRQLDKTVAQRTLNFKRSQECLTLSVGIELLLRPPLENERQELEKYIVAATDFIETSRKLYRQ